MHYPRNIFSLLIIFTQVKRSLIVFQFEKHSMEETFFTTAKVLIS